ncbi:MAG TPA: hypothetical protein VG755_05215 [Nannocystaceae bacterium]|nr:hypothetical protein [Nannocystaceae bacterium]
MGRRICAGLAAVLSWVVACSGGPGGGSEGGASGKGDDIDTAGEAVCSLDDDESRALAQFVVQKTVQFRCRGSGGQFVETECCTPELDEFVFATGCPTQAKFNTGSGSDKQCVEDRPDSSESVDGELVVPTVCCGLLCDPKAKWDDATTMATCRASNGQFHPDVCCMMNDDARCGDATFDAEPDALGYRHCRVRTGELAGQFAPGACCVDACFELVTEGLEVPIDCLLALDDECDGASVDASGRCVLAEGFAKASCCSGMDGLGAEEADRCYLAELQGDDLAAEGCT